MGELSQAAEHAVTLKLKDFVFQARQGVSPEALIKTVLDSMPEHNWRRASGRDGLERYMTHGSFGVLEVISIPVEDKSIETGEVISHKMCMARLMADPGASRCLGVELVNPSVFDRIASIAESQCKAPDKGPETKGSRSMRRECAASGAN